MKFKALFLSLVLSILSGAAIAGSGHDHGHSHSYTPVNQATAEVNAADIVAELIKRNQLDNSWSTIKASSIEKITVKGNPEWVAVFVNNKVADKDKQKLYVFLNLGGQYIAANFTGK